MAARGACAATADADDRVSQHRLGCCQHCALVNGFHRGLGAAGFAEGRNLAIEYRWADNRADRLPTLVADLVARRVAVIVTGGATAAALAAKAATSIVFTIGADPVKVGLVDSMSRPSGNVTGASFLANDLVAKQLQLLQALLPPASVIGVLANQDNPNAASDAGRTQAAAAALRMQIHVVNVAAERDIDAAFDDLARARAAALLVFPDTLFIDVRRRLVEIAAARRLPAIYSNRLYMPGYEASGWYGLGAPKGVAAEIIDKLNNEIAAALADPKIKVRLADLGVTVLAGSPADFGKLLIDETEKWGKVVKFSGAKPD